MAADDGPVERTADARMIEDAETAGEGVSIDPEPAGHPDTAEYPEFVDQIPAIIYVADPGETGIWHYVSPQIRSILGFTAEEWCADPHMWEARLHPDDRPSALSVEDTASIHSTNAGALEYRLRHRDGHFIWIRDDARIVRNHEGSLRWYGVLSDITARKRAEAELEQRAAQQSAVARLGEHALEGATTGELMREAVTAAATILDLDIGSVFELSDAGDMLILRQGYGWSLPAGDALRAPAGHGSQSGFAILTGGPVIVEDWEHETRFSKPAILEAARARSGVSVVIEGRKGPFGVLAVQSLSLRAFSPGDIHFLQSLANVLADALDRQSTEDGIRHRALHDALTGLPNRVLFIDRLSHALTRLRRRRSLTAVLFLDLDRFKLVNDSLGHHVGDELLAAVAPRLSTVVRSSDTVARFGGDEFGILLEDIPDEHDAVEMAERIAAVFTRPFVLAGSEHFVTTSIGIAVAHGGERAEELIRDADAAMYRAKEHGRARYELFDEVMRARAFARLRVENDLRRAVDRDELALVYQPVVSLRDHTLVGVEALVRWRHPERGLVGPSEFIEIAEENGLIEPIGRWVLDQAARQGVRWHQAHPDCAPIGVSVNLSAVQVAQKTLVDTVSDVLNATGIDPNALSLEITESAILTEMETTGGALDRLKAIGVRLVLDDFGTGYSSLGYLTHLPLDVLKIDRSFIDGLGVDRRDTAITEAIIAMSHALSLEVVAEGVQTEVQAHELERLGCYLAQGFCFSSPVPAVDITRMLDRGGTCDADFLPRR